MAEKVQAFDLWSPITEDFDQMNLTRIAEIRRRWVENHSWGILRENSYLPAVNIPVSEANPRPNRKPVIQQFPITLHTGTGFFDVCPAALSTANPPVLASAYDLNGERIAVTDPVPFNPSTSGPAGSQSTGNISVPLVIGGSGSPVPGTYYAWIEYLEVNDPAYTDTDEVGGTHFPVIHDGYRIVLTATNVAPTADGISIFLAKIIWTGPFAGTLVVDDVTATLVSDSNGNSINTKPTEIGRAYSAVRDKDVEIQIDLNFKTLFYGNGFIGTVRDHVMAMGSVTPTANNPHGLGLPDIPGAGAEPIATSNQATALNKGFIDTTLSQNSPGYRSQAFKPTVVAATLASNPGLDPAAASADLPIPSNATFARYIRITSPVNPVDGSSFQAAYVNGFKLTKMFPTLNQSTNPGSTDGWIGFQSSDVPGTYIIYGTHAVLQDGTDVLILTKKSSSVLDQTLPKNLAICQVFWDGSNLWLNSLVATPNQVNDLRSFGLVGPKQPSTEIKSNPNTGSWSQEVLDNLVGNSNYALPNFQSITQVGTGPTAVIPSGGGGQPVQINAGNDPTLASGGPGAITGLQFTTNNGSVATLSDSLIFHKLANLKPSKFHAISFWYKASSSFNCKTRVGIADGNGATPNPLITLDGISPTQPVEITVVNDSLWHRASLIVQSLATVNPDPAVNKFLEFLFQQGGQATTSGTFEITNISVTEGEWVPGYVAGRMIASGGNVFYDDVTSCPPGFVINTNLSGRLPIGANGTLTVGTNVGTAASSPSIYIGHTHNVAATSTNVQSGPNAGVVNSVAGSGTGGPTSAANADIPTRAGIWCKAI